jgi:hypothetical protein
LVPVIGGGTGTVVVGGGAVVVVVVGGVVVVVGGGGMVVVVVVQPHGPWVAVDPGWVGGVDEVVTLHAAPPNVTLKAIITIADPMATMVRFTAVPCLLDRHPCRRPNGVRWAVGGPVTPICHRSDGANLEPSTRSIS